MTGSIGTAAPAHRGVRGVALLPQELERPNERPRAHLPPVHVGPLIHLARHIGSTWKQKSDLQISKHAAVSEKQLSVQIGRLQTHMFIVS
jgi:hypothetical protein